jgi:hypothetical protein
MFDDQAMRLLREKWPNADLLAEELFAILTAERPTLTNGPIVINNESDQTPLIIRNLGDAPFAIEIITSDPTKEDGFKNAKIDNDGNPVVDEEDEEEAEGGGSVPGQVVSGSGTSYSVQIYENGSGSASTQTVTVRVPNLADGEDLSEGDWLLVSLLANGTYEALATVWM